MDAVEKSLDMPTEAAKDTLAQVVESMSGLDVLTLSKVMIQSGYFPDLKSMAQAVVKILAGRELGFGPIASLRHIYMHRNHIGLMAQLMASAIRRSGRYDYKVLVCDDEHCEIEFFRMANGQPEPLGTATFTITEAKRAGLVKDDSAWQTYPSDVLFARAISRGQRRFCPDVFQQTIYSKEELDDLVATEEGAPAAAALDLMPRKVGELAPASSPIQSGPESSPPDPDAELREIMGAMLGEESPATAEATESGPAEKGTATAAGAEGLARPELPHGQVTAPAREPLRFTIGKTPYETAGITRDQMLSSFDLEPKVEKKQKGLTRAILKSFGVEHRWQLTEEQGERLLIRLSETLGIDPPWVKGTGGRRG